MGNQLIVFAKNPVLGKVKTRLAATIGPKKALEVYIKLIEHTRNVITPFVKNTIIYFTDYANSSAEWLIFNQRIQTGESLGNRMCNAFHTAFSEGKKSVIIIGTDCYEISSEIISTAFKELENNDVVIGPAEDGGYYLLGMNQLHEDLFRNKKWSTDTVFIDTIEDIKQLGLKHKSLPTLVDIDTEEELKKFKGILI